MTSWSTRAALRSSRLGVSRFGTSSASESRPSLPWSLRKTYLSSYGSPGYQADDLCKCKDTTIPSKVTDGPLTDGSDLTANNADSKDGCSSQTAGLFGTVDGVLESQLASNGELTIVERLANLLDTGHFADMNIQVGEGKDAKVFKAHRLLLATASQPLCRMVCSVKPSAGSGDVTTLRVTDIEPEAFQNVLKFIYTDDLGITSVNEAYALLKASQKWGLKALGERTIKFLCDFLGKYKPSTEQMKNDLCELLMLSDGQHEDLAEKCWETILTFANEVIPCQKFLDMDHMLLKRLIGHSDFNYKNHLALFEAIRDWGMNQVLQRNMSASQLQKVVEELLGYVNLEDIKDGDFINTVLPSECLGKAEIIAFFMTRGLEIPRDLVCNNNKEISTMTQNGSVMEFSKACRFRRGYQLPQDEIYKEHELRFRVDKNIRLLGVGFGFLFSNTDMGIAVHCQGPWERVQWTDIIRTYCRVSWEKMKTADVRLMFTDPVKIEANHSYKIHVRIGRMSCGASEVDFWGGSRGLGTIEAKDATFYFLNSAVDPNKEVEEKEQDTKDGIITELFYQLDKEEKVEEEIVVNDNKPPADEQEISEQSLHQGRRRRNSNLIETEEKETETSNPWRRERKKSTDSPVLPSYRHLASSGQRTTTFEVIKPVDIFTSRRPIAMSQEPKRERTESHTKQDITSHYLRRRPSTDSYNRVRPSPIEEGRSKEIISSFNSGQSRTRETASRSYLGHANANSFSLRRSPTPHPACGTSLTARESSVTRSGIESRSRYRRDSSASRYVPPDFTDTKDSTTRLTGESSVSSLYRRDSKSGRDISSRYSRDTMTSYCRDAQAKLGRDISASLRGREPTEKSTTSRSTYASGSLTSHPASRSGFGRSYLSDPSTSSTLSKGSYGSSYSRYGTSYSRY